MHTSTTNPFYAARVQQVAPARPEEPARPVYAKLPVAPLNASPVPHLTSLYHSAETGDCGDRSYPGNCGGNVIKDLLRYFKPFTVFDPMTGSGTCRDVCAELGVYCYSSDLHEGADACDASRFPRQCFDFCWVHPPYWRMKKYNDDPRCLSRAPTLEAFLERYRLLIANCAGSLAPDGLHEPRKPRPPHFGTADCRILHQLHVVSRCSEVKKHRYTASELGACSRFCRRIFRQKRMISV
jgi:hypothetical protein